jgi:Predicted hydrolases of the HAD superfamily
MARIELPKLVATDLDGTLVRSDETVSDYSLAVLRKVREAGVTLVGVTGRGPRLIELCRRDLPVADLFVMANGAYVLDQRDPDAVRVLRRERLPGPDLAEALRRIEGVAGPLSVLVEALEDPRAPLWGDSHVVWPYPEWVPYDRAEALAGPVYKGFASAADLTADELLALAAQVVPPDLATLTQSGLGYIELMAPGVDKATGLAVVAEELGIGPSDVCVFGDMPNDVPMFRWAGWRRVAVANAHPSVLELADEVTASNDADGVAAWLEALLSA